MVRATVDFLSVWTFQSLPGCTPYDCYTVAPGDALTATLLANDAAHGSCGGAAEGATCPIGTCRHGACRPPAAATYPIDVPGDASAWTVFTNCSGCTPATLQFVASDGGYLRLATNGLPCTAGCSYPGGYAFVPKRDTAPGRALFHFSARASSANAQVRLTAYDAGGAYLQQATAGVAQGTAFSAGALGAMMPAGTAKVLLDLYLPDPNATLDLDWLEIDLIP